MRLQHPIKNSNKRHNERVHREICKIGDNHTNQPTILNQHKESSHEGNKSTCDQREYQAASTTNLEQHINREHQKISGNAKNEARSQTTKKPYMSRRLQCDGCDKKFNKEETYKKHMKQVHGGKVDNKTSEINQQNKHQSKLTFQRILRSNKQTISTLDTII